MLALDNGDKIRGDASAATVVDYTLHGIIGTTVTQLADGQLAATITDIYTAGAAVAVTGIVLVNTDTVARTVNLYLTPSAGTARRLIAKDYSLAAGASLVFDGRSSGGGGITDINAFLDNTAGGTDGEVTKAPTSNVLFDALALKAPLASPSFTGTVNIAGLTASEILGTNASKNLVSLAVATYPSLTELSYVKGVTSVIQTQLDAKSGIVWKATNAESLADLNRTANLNWTDLDLTSVSSANAKYVVVLIQISVDSITAGAANYAQLQIRKNGDTPSWAAFSLYVGGETYAAGSIVRDQGMCAVDAGQVLEYTITFGGTAQVDTYITVIGYLE